MLPETSHRLEDHQILYISEIEWTIQNQSAKAGKLCDGSIYGRLHGWTQRKWSKFWSCKSNVKDFFPDFETNTENCCCLPVVWFLQARPIIYHFEHDWHRIIHQGERLVSSISGCFDATFVVILCLTDLYCPRFTRTGKAVACFVFTFLPSLQDKLGLKTMHKAGKLHFLSCPGNHLQFTEEWFITNIINKFL